MRAIILIVAVVATILPTSTSCVSGSCSSSMCSDIPANNQYYLTSFCDKSVACGAFSGNCNEYYAADYKRFGCNSISKMSSYFLYSFPFIKGQL